MCSLCLIAQQPLISDRSKSYERLQSVGRFRFRIDQRNSFTAPAMARVIRVAGVVELVRRMNQSCSSKLTDVPTLQQRNRTEPATEPMGIANQLIRIRIPSPSD